MNNFVHAAIEAERMDTMTGVGIRVGEYVYTADYDKFNVDRYLRYGADVYFARAPAALQKRSGDMARLSSRECGAAVALWLADAYARRLFAIGARIFHTQASALMRARDGSAALCAIITRESDDAFGAFGAFGALMRDITRARGENFTRACIRSQNFVVLKTCCKLGNATALHTLFGALGALGVSRMPHTILWRCVIVCVCARVDARTCIRGMLNRLEFARRPWRLAVSAAIAARFGCANFYFFSRNVYP